MPAPPQSVEQDSALCGGESFDRGELDIICVSDWVPTLREPKSNKPTLTRTLVLASKRWLLRPDSRSEGWASQEALPISKEVP
jgi:hypothetical protein